MALDINQLDSSICGFAYKELIGNILDKDLIQQLNGEYELETIYDALIN